MGGSEVCVLKVGGVMAVISSLTTLRIVWIRASTVSPVGSVSDDGPGRGSSALGGRVVGGAVASELVTDDVGGVLSPVVPWPDILVAFTMGK